MKFTIRGSDVDVKNANSESPEIWTKIWLCVGIIDALCFRNSGNQEILSSQLLFVGKTVSLSVSLLEIVKTLNVPLLLFIDASLCTPTIAVEVIKTNQGSPTRSQSQPSVNSPFSPEQTASTCRKFALDIDSESVGSYEVFIACLKCLISLSHHCNKACWEMCTSGGLDTLVDYLDVFCSLRCNLNEKLLKEGESYDRSLSPQETIVERILFDSIVCLLTLLTNLLEYEGSKFSEYILTLTFKYTKFPVSCFGYDGSSSLDPVVNDLPRFLSLMLLRESSVFMSIIEETEIMKPPQESEAPSTEGKVNESDRIPISEIIVSAHICLLIHAILHTKPPDDIDNKNGYYLQAKESFIQYLPRKSFWLPMRILKAFLSLQEKTEVLILDNMAPVLDVITIMSSLENVQRLALLDACPCVDERG